MGYRIYRFTASLFSCLGVIGCASVCAQSQIAVPRIEQMPNVPRPYHMRDWRQVALDFDALAFDEGLQGEHLPLIRRVKGPGVEGRETFGLDTYVGWHEELYESITCLGAINGASIAGIDKRNPQGVDWVALAANHFRDQPELQLYLNGPDDRSGSSFWYEIFPNILFYRVFDRYPDTPGMADQFRSVADQWLKACQGMGGRVEPWLVPDFKHTAYDFNTQQPVDNGLWTEAGSAAGIAWLEYMAYVKTGERTYLQAAKWGLDYLEHSTENPYYEGLFPHAPYVAARMNAEQGTDYDIEKLVNWCFDGSNPRQWGESVGRSGGMDMSGLVCSLWSEPKGNYAFAMNTFNKANSLVPMVRYDTRFARAVGKWMLNAANSMRLLYPNGLPPDHQTDAAWAAKYDPASCIAYEGLRREETILSRLEADYDTRYGRCSTGTVKQTLYTDKQFQVFEMDDGKRGERLQHVWRTALPTAESHEITMVSLVTEGETVSVSYAYRAEGPFVPLFTFNAPQQQVLTAMLTGKGADLYLRVEDAGSENAPGTFSVDDVWITSKTDKRPYTTGDARDSRWADTNLGLYGSAFVGLFGGIIQTTSVERILRLDCLATDYFAGPAYPTYLYFNPYDEAHEIEVEVGGQAVDVYDAVSNRFLARNVQKRGSITLPGDRAVLALLLPSGGQFEQRDGQQVYNGIVVDYQARPSSASGE